MELETKLEASSSSWAESKRSM